MRSRGEIRAKQRVCLGFIAGRFFCSPCGKLFCGLSAGRHPWSAAWHDARDLRPAFWSEGRGLPCLSRRKF